MSDYKIILEYKSDIFDLDIKDSFKKNTDSKPKKDKKNKKEKDVTDKEPSQISKKLKTSLSTIGDGIKEVDLKNPSSLIGGALKVGQGIVDTVLLSSKTDK